MTWCTFAVIQGVEHEELFDADLNPLGSSDNHVGDVSGFAPPGDIDRVHNIGETTAISIPRLRNRRDADRLELRPYYD